MTRTRRYALSTSLGLLSGLSFAPLSIWLLMLVGFCGLVWLLDSRLKPVAAAVCGWLFGLGQFAVSLYWISISFQFQGNMPVWLGWLAVLILAGYLAIYPALALLVASRCWSKSPARVLVLAASWTAFEWLRGHLLSGFPWNMIAQVWSETPLMLQSARIWGAYGLSLLTAALFALPAVLLDRTPSSRRFLLASAAIASLLLLDGWLRLSRDPATAGGFRVHLVQADVRQDLEADPARQGEILARYDGLTRSAIRERGQAIVIWPETALELDVESDATLRARLAAMVGEDGLLILGAVGHRYGADGAWLGARNSLLAIDGRGSVRGVYDKTTLVPFGEYLPAAHLLSRLGLVSVAGGTNRFLRGSGPTTLAPGTPPFSPMICYEIIFPGAVTAPGARPSWILNISNDAWFGDSWGPHQHFAQARIRAVEEGLPVVRSTPTGISGVIDPHGRALARSRLGEQIVLTEVVPPPLAQTPYSRFGDWLFIPLLVTFATFGAWTTQKAQRAFRLRP